MSGAPVSRRFVGWALRVAVRALGWTVRARRHGRGDVDALLGQGERIVYAFWHGRQFTLLGAHAGEPAVIMVSHSADGDLQDGVCRQYGFDTVRGSSSRGGQAALARMADRIADDGYHGALAVDGPRGPREVAKPGAVALAARCGGWVVPVTAAIRRRWRVGSWDRLEIPWPFARAEVVYGAPFRVEDSDGGRREGLRTLQATLDEATTRAHALAEGHTT